MGDNTEHSCIYTDGICACGAVTPYPIPPANEPQGERFTPQEIDKLLARREIPLDLAACRAYAAGADAQVERMKARAEAAEAAVEVWQREAGTAQADADMWRRSTDELILQLGSLRDLLREIEWSGVNRDEPACVSCGAYQYLGTHETDCALNAAIK